MFSARILMFKSQRGYLPEIAGTLSREERADRNRRVFLGRHARLFRRRREAKSGDARRRKRVHLCQDDGRTSDPLPTDPRAGLRRRKFRQAVEPSSTSTRSASYLHTSFSTDRTNCPASSPTSGNSCSMIARTMTALRSTSADRGFIHG